MYCTYRYEQNIPFQIQQYGPLLKIFEELQQDIIITVNERPIAASPLLFRLLGVLLSGLERGVSSLANQRHVQGFHYSLDQSRAWVLG